MSYELVKPKWDSHRQILRSITMLDGYVDERVYEIRSWQCWICLERADGKSHGICLNCEKDFPIKKNHQ